MKMVKELPPGLTKRLLLLITITVTGSLLQAEAQECSIQLSCGDCIAQAECSWCSSDSQSFTGTRRCGLPANLTEASCDAIEDPDSQQIQITRSTENNPTVNVSNVELRLRVGDPLTFSVSVTPRRNLPLDLYILIDLSASMSGNLQALKSIAGNIANEIRNVTRNIRIGFGSFNEKITRPYTYEFTSNDCRVAACRPNYAFRHRISLTNDIPYYNKTLQGVQTTFNSDRPENGLEALAQVVACEDIIGWRDRRATGDDRGLTRVVLFMTDDAFHYAGEGQLAGILNPYEGECLLDPPAENETTVEFTRWREVDYPSVGQIVQMLHENEVTVIFAIEQERIATYQSLSDLINLWSRASVSKLEENATSILSLIDREITRLLQEVSLLPSDDSGQLDISITPFCPEEHNSQVLSNGNGRGCNNIPLETTVKFQVSVTLRNCDGFEQPGAFKTHRVLAPGFGEFTITFTGECQCSCEQNATIGSEKCSGNGDFICGVCECYEGWCGPSCSQTTDAQADDVCLRGGINNELCSGPARGICVCSCECTDPYFGPACECDKSDNSCPRNARGAHCNGQGDCCDGRCRCKEDENGFQYRHNGTIETCACPPAEAVCRDSNGTLCSERGSCGCSGCSCSNGFFGTVCQSRDVGTCGDSIDSSCIRQCIEGDFNNEACRSCEPYRPIIVVSEEVPEGSQTNEYLETIASRELMESYMYELDCETLIDEDCTYVYYLLRGPQMYAIMLLQTPEHCLSTRGGISLPFEPYFFAPIIFGVLLIIGLAIFIVAKIIICVLDYLEVKRLDQETKNIKFDMASNPLYQNPEIEYKNVAYGKN